MYKPPKVIKSTKKIKGSKRQVRLENMWLLYNYDTFQGVYWTRKHAMADANWMMEGIVDNKNLPENFQILKGTVNISLEQIKE